MAKVHLTTALNAGKRRKKNTYINKILVFFRGVFKVGKVIITLFIAVIVGFFFWVFIDDPRYKIKDVHIEGLKYFSDMEVKKVANIFLDRGIVKLKEDEVKKELLKIPFIENCSLEKDYEGKRIIIHIQELVPYATVFINDQMFLISHTGKILKKLQSMKEVVGPLITGLSLSSDMEPGSYIDDEKLWCALEFWYEYNQVPKNRNIQISEIVIDSTENLKVFFDEIPCETRWKRENLKRQIQNFSIALNKVDITRVQCSEYIDMRFNDDIIYK